MVHRETKYKGFEKWEKVMDISVYEWQSCFKSLVALTKDTKLWWLQYRILHHILTTNRSVSKFNKEQSHLCEFCKAHSETIYHLLWESQHVKTFWEELRRNINNRCNTNCRLGVDEKLTLFGISKDNKVDNVIDLILLLAKSYIYRCKVQGSVLYIRLFLNEVHNRFCIEKNINSNYNIFMEKWSPYINLFRNVM